jgi:hypothetical protein
MIPDLIRMFFEDDLISKEQYESMKPLKKPYGERLGSFLVTNEFSTRDALETFLKENEDSLFELFNQWLTENSKIAHAIIWRVESSKEKSDNDGNAYLSWDQLKKMELSNTFWKTLLNVQAPLDEAPPCTVKLYENGKVFSTDFKPNEAWKYYLAYVTQSLTAELDKLVHWSIFRYDKRRLKLLLDSRTLFEYFKSRDVYSILRWHGTSFNHGSATPGDPTKIYNFLNREKLIGITRWDSIGHLLGWCRENLYHFEGENTPENYKKHWQYEGYPPVERIISGTEHPTLGFRHFTAGCWGTTGFLRTVLRTINIPVVLEERCGHALPHFAYDTAHEFYLSHGDDPYNKLYKTTTFQFPPIDLIIDHSKFDKWFDKNLPEETICNNVGRHVFELAFEYLPDKILEIYCDDLANNRPHENGRVYNEIFKDHISLNELERFGFWNRIKSRVEKLGGCKNVPHN